MRRGLWCHDIIMISIKQGPLGQYGAHLQVRGPRWAPHWTPCTIPSAWPSSLHNHYKVDIRAMPLTSPANILCRHTLKGTSGLNINSLQPSVTIRCQTSWSTLSHVMVCHLLNTERLPEPMLTHGPLGTNCSENLIKIQTFALMKMYLNMLFSKWL